MKVETRIGILRIVCWLAIVIIPSGAIYWFADFYGVDIGAGIIAVALPSILVAERVFCVVLRKSGLWDRSTRPKID
jgi:hypothetical protein